MKTLLVATKNSTIDYEFKHKTIIDFSGTNGKIDGYITERILPKLNNVDIIFIDLELTDHLLDFYCFDLILHIRLSISTLRFSTIVLVSDYDKAILNEREIKARVLFTKNIFVIKNTEESIEKFQQTQNLKPLTLDEYQNDFLDLIEVQPPENSTSHSIANEWAIERWASLLNADTLAIKNNRKSISSMLYIKYLSEKYNVNSSSQVYITKEAKKGKILFIDDKGTDGWNDIIDKYTDLHYTDLEFKALSNNKTDFSDIQKIKKEVKISIEKSIPNIVLLDLRLLPDESKKVDEISGVQILEYIKKLNPSIQVIMFTASNDSSILDKLFKIGILGYVRKDAPTDKDKTVNNGFEKLDELIRESIEKEYLMDVYQIQKDIISSKILNENRTNIEQKKKKNESLKFNKVFKLSKEEEELNELEQVIKTVFKVLNSNMPDNYIFAIQSIYKCIETICTYYIEEIEKKNKHNESCRPKKYEAYWRYDNINIGTTATWNKLSKIKERFNIEYEDKLFNNLKDIRNMSIHPANILDELNIQSNDIIEWFEMLKTIIKAINEIPQNAK